MEITTPRADRAWCSTRINDDSSPTEGDKAELRRHSVFLGQNGNFDFWGDPNSGHVLSVGIPSLGTRSANYGDWLHFRLAIRRPGWRLTRAGQNWGAGCSK